MNPDKQAVTDTETDDLSTDEGQDARDDGPTLDELLDEIEEDQVETAKPEPQGTDLSERLAKLEKQTEDRDRTDTAKDIETGISETVDRFLEDGTISKVYDKDEVQGLIQVEAARNPKISIAFGLRHSKPSEWRKIEAGLMKKIEGRAAGKVSQNQGDRETAEDAAQGVSNNAPVEDSSVPDQASLAGMSGKELDDVKRSLDPDYGA